MSGWILQLITMSKDGSPTAAPGDLTVTLSFRPSGGPGLPTPLPTPEGVIELITEGMPKLRRSDSPTQPPTA